MRGRPLDDHGFAANLYRGVRKPKTGIILGTGVLGNRYGLEDAAIALAERLEAAVITLDGSGHHRNGHPFRLGEDALEQRLVARFLRSRVGVNQVIGGGHSAGAVAGLFAALGYNPVVEGAMLLGKPLESSLPEHEPLFDALLLAAPPANMRGVVPGWMLTRQVLSLLQRGFHRENGTYQLPDGGKTHYVEKQGADAEWKHLWTPNLAETRRYVSRIPNPSEYHALLRELETTYAPPYLDDLDAMPKLWLVGTRDINLFGSKVLFGLHASPGQRREYHAMLSSFGENSTLRVYDGAAHFLNHHRKFEVDSLYGLRSPVVQEDIAGFVERLR